MSQDEDFASLFQEFEQKQAGAAHREPKVGDKVKGRILSVQGESVFVDLGTKTEGVVERGELLGDDGELNVAVGDSIETVVSGKDPDSGVFLLGHQQAKRLHGIEELRRAFAEGTPVEGHVSGAIKGGLEVELSGVRAFCPASQADIRFVENLEEFVGQRLAFRITKFEGGHRPNLVLSRRALLEEEQRELAEQTRARLEIGAVLSGKVTNLKDFGAFVDLGGIEGMVHVSELSFGRVKHPSEVLSVGQSVEVAVLRIEKSGNPRQGERIALSLRALEQDPWQDVAAEFPVGSRVSGTVSRLQPFGAFVELAPGVDGLVHISELGAGKRINHPSEVLSEGQAVEATVLSVDPDKKRIGLSLNQDAKTAEPPGERKTPADYGKPKQGFGTLGDLLKESMAKQKKS